MGVSPSRLLYGPTANYGSIIIPCICHRRLREQPGLCVSVLSLASFEGRGAPTLWLDLSVDAGNVPDEMDIQLWKIISEDFVLSLL